jgi:hypothetical protein
VCCERETQRAIPAALSAFPQVGLHQACHRGGPRLATADNTGFTGWRQSRPAAEDNQPLAESPGKSVRVSVGSTQVVLSLPDGSERILSDLDVYLRTAHNSPLDSLPTAAKQRFLASLVFTENGFGGYSYAELEALSTTEVTQILSLFGAEGGTSAIKSPKSVIRGLLPDGDYVGYECTARASCTESQKHICMHSC